MTITTEMLLVCAREVGVELRDDVDTINRLYVRHQIYKGSKYEEYHPPTHADQDRMLRDWLSDNGYTVCYNEQRPDPFGAHEWIHSVFKIQPNVLRRDVIYRGDCPPNELCTRAVYEVSK